MNIPRWPRRSSSAIPDAYRGQAPLAFVTLRAGEVRTGEELRDFLRDKISAIELPVRVEIRTSLPKTVIGKLSRKELVAEAGGVDFRVRWLTYRLTCDIGWRMTQGRLYTVTELAQDLGDDRAGDPLL